MDTECEVILFGNVNAVKMLNDILTEIRIISLHLSVVTEAIKRKSQNIIVKC